MRRRHDPPPTHASHGGTKERQATYNTKALRWYVVKNHIFYYRFIDIGIDITPAEAENP